MGGIVRGIGDAVGGVGSVVGSVAGAGIGSALGGGVGSVVGAGLGSVIGGVVGSGKGGGIGSVVGGLANTTAVAGSPVSWSLAAEAVETIVSLQQVSIPAVLLAVYRIRNTGSTNPNARGGSVVIHTDNGSFDLPPGASIDISTQTITLRTGVRPAVGTYQLLGNALVGNRGV